MTPLSGWWTAGRLRDDERGSHHRKGFPRCIANKDVWGRGYALTYDF